ncbi:hypothetical protein [Caproiciproducens galactitolivorans]|uniref:Uncharacterized protein n=1 Tax=Caproiciproducens galactitolivorans TaxID=642589 RepID=A0ABT4BWC1_9FIRM|nr:hypothetical protein [Caproiciproducens galactitolivorans]MCY1715205.1 hypothetical protein [Caproiciproducens galactitolivorans]
MAHTAGRYSIIEATVGYDYCFSAVYPLGSKWGQMVPTKAGGWQAAAGHSIFSPFYAA